VNINVFQHLSVVKIYSFLLDKSQPATTSASASTILPPVVKKETAPSKLNSIPGDFAHI